MIPFNNGEELQTYEHRYIDAVKVYIPPCVVFVRSPKGTRSPVGLGVSINTMCHISLTTCNTLDNFGKSRIEEACLKAIDYDKQNSERKTTEEQVMKKHNCTSNKKGGCSSEKDSNFQQVFHIM